MQEINKTRSFLPERKGLLSILLLIIICLQGCSSRNIQVRNPFVNPDTEEVIYHPDFPDSIPPFMKGRIKSVQYRDSEDKVQTIVGFLPDDSQLFRLWEEQRDLRAVKLEKIICYYRDQLEAPKNSSCDKHEIGEKDND